MIQISKGLLFRLLEFTSFEISVIGNDIYYTIYDREHYSSEELTAEQGMELQKLKHIINIDMDNNLIKELEDGK